MFASIFGPSSEELAERHRRQMEAEAELRAKKQPGGSLFGRSERFGKIVVPEPAANVVANNVGDCNLLQKRQAEIESGVPPETYTKENWAEIRKACEVMQSQTCGKSMPGVHPLCIKGGHLGFVKGPAQIGFIPNQSRQEQAVADIARNSGVVTIPSAERPREPRAAPIPAKRLISTAVQPGQAPNRFTALLLN